MPKSIASKILNSSIESVLSAVEAYNKPRKSFKVQVYIPLMIIGYIRLFQAFFKSKNIPYFYRKKGSNRFVKIDGDKKAWDITRCIKEYEERNESKFRTFYRT